MFRRRIVLLLLPILVNPIVGLQSRLIRLSRMLLVHLVPRHIYMTIPVSTNRPHHHTRHIPRNLLSRPTMLVHVLPMRQIHLRIMLRITPIRRLLVRHLRLYHM